MFAMGIRGVGKSNIVRARQRFTSTYLLFRMILCTKPTPWVCAGTSTSRCEVCDMKVNHTPPGRTPTGSGMSVKWNLKSQTLITNRPQASEVLPTPPQNRYNGRHVELCCRRATLPNPNRAIRDLSFSIW